MTTCTDDIAELALIASAMGKPTTRNVEAWHLKATADMDPADIPTREGATCVRFTPRQRQMIASALSPGETVATMARTGALLLALLRANGVVDIEPVNKKPDGYQPSGG